MPDIAVRYEPRGAAAELFRRKDGEILISGAAGTGKSVAALMKLHLACLSTPKVRCLIARKTHTSLTASTLVSFKEKVAKEALESGLLHYYGGSGSEPASFRYRNGSTIIIGGLDRASRLLSTEFDLAFLDEATETTSEDVETIISRLRNGRLSYHQLIMATNPDAPTHHLKKRADSGKCLMLYSKHEDNPRLHNNGQWTEEGRAYLDRLENLTGTRYHRLRWGRWVARDGLVYEDFDPSVHVIEPFSVPADFPLYVSVDFGFVHSFVAQFWRADEDERLYLQREVFFSRRLVEDHAQQIMDIIAQIGVRPTAVVCDHAIESRGVLERHTGLITTAADKAVSDGIQAVQSRLRVQEDGRPRMFFFKDALVERDPLLVEAGKPTCTVEEFPGYVWDTRKEAPVKENDDGMDTARYMAMHLEDGFDFEIGAL